jgi:predicted dehydrogenase
MRFAIIGTGSIGQRHLKNLRALGHETVVFDTDRRRAEEAAATVGADVLPSLEAGADAKLDGVLVCTPPVSHLPLARIVLPWGSHLFIEKPVAAESAGVSELLAAAAAQRSLVLVGANLRFFRPLQRVKTLVDEGRIGRVLSVRAQCGFYLPWWKPGADYRQLYRSQAAEGGGILLDVIHEFDYLRWIFGDVKEVFCTAERLSGLAIDVEDFAEVTLRFHSGVVAQLHLDYLQRSYRRDCEIIGERGVIVWDYIEPSVTLFTEERDSWLGFREPLDFSHNEMFLEEMRHFARCIAGDERPLIDGAQALAALRVVEAAKTSSARRAWVTP